MLPCLGSFLLADASWCIHHTSCVRLDGRWHYCTRSMDRTIRKEPGCQKLFLLLSLKKSIFFTLNGTDGRFHPITSKHIFYFLVMMKGKRKWLLQVYPQKKKPVWVWPDSSSTLLSWSAIGPTCLSGVASSTNWKPRSLTDRLWCNCNRQTWQPQSFHPKSFKLFSSSQMFSMPPAPNPASGRVKNNLPAIAPVRLLHLKK